MRPVSFLAHSTNSLPFAASAALLQSNFLLVEPVPGYNRFTDQDASRVECRSNDSPSMFRKPAMDSQRTPNSNSESENSTDRSTPEVESHEERLARIKAEIEAGVYETPEKLEIAIDRMFGTLVD